jgi:hypothetical protein
LLILTVPLVLVQEDDPNDEHVVYYLSKILSPNEIKYSYVEKLALASIHIVQCFHHYILLHKTTIISDYNPMQHILTRQVLGGKYSKCIFILQEFDLEFEKSKSNKSLLFSKMICDLPSFESEILIEESIPDECFFLIISSDLRYKHIIIYLQTHTFRLDLYSIEHHHIRYQAHQYIVIYDTLYRRGVYSIFRRCLTHEEAERALNDCHVGACGGHMFGYATAQKMLRAGYFLSSLFKDCILAIQKCHTCQIYNHKLCAPPAPLHLIVFTGTFSKWGIHFMIYNPHLLGGGRGYC